MAITRGCLGAVKVKDLAASGAAATIGELADWSYEESGEQVDVSKMGDCTKRFSAGAQQTTGEVTCWWDPTDTPQGTLTVGNDVVIEIYPAGPTSGATYYKTPAAGANINRVARAGNGVDGHVNNVFGFTINGALITTTVP